MIDSTYSVSSFSGLVSSKRRLVPPPNSSARPKSRQMALAWPICRYPFGSGGKRVHTRPLYLPLFRSSIIVSRIKLEGRAGSGAGVPSGLGFDAVIGFALSAAQSNILIAGGQNQKPAAQQDPKRLDWIRDEGPTMRRAIYGIAMMVCTACFLHAAAQGDKKISPKAQERIAKEVRHQILMLPDFGNFDNIAFNLNGYDVTLYGQVVKPLLTDTAVM